MVQAIRQRVTIGSGGVVQVHSPDLPAGSQAGVIVLLDSAPPSKRSASVAARLDALDQVQKELNLTPESAAKWMAEVRQERQAIGTRPAAQP